MIAQVAVSCAVYAIDQPYSYCVPENMELLPGMRVVVPFGRANRRTEAIVLTITTGSEAGSTLRLLPTERCRYRG